MILIVDYDIYDRCLCYEFVKYISIKIHNYSFFMTYKPANQRPSSEVKEVIDLTKVDSLKISSGNILEIFMLTGIGTETMPILSRADEDVKIDLSVTTYCLII